MKKFAFALFSAILLVGSGCTNAQKTIPTPSSSLNTPQAVETQVPSFSQVELDRINSQLKAFEDYLEYYLIGAQIDCNVYATYNNLLSGGQMDVSTFQQAFPDSKESYENKCRSSYLGVVTKQKILVAEPELQSLRVLLTSYAEESNEFSLYALGGGHQTLRIDLADKKMDSLRILAREEVLRLKRVYK